MKSNSGTEPKEDPLSSGSQKNSFWNKTNHQLPTKRKSIQHQQMRRPQHYG